MYYINQKGKWNKSKVKYEGDVTFPIIVHMPLYMCIYM